MTGDEKADEDEWEYEYDQNETETFLIDVDLTTVNRSFRPSSAIRQKRLHEISERAGSKRRRTGTQANGKSSNNTTTQLQDNRTLEDDQAQDFQPEDVGEAESAEHGLQILDLDTSNPIISYEGQIYSCNWSDMIGTTMFFSNPQENTMYDSEMSTPDFDMVGISRIKLVGTVAKVTPVQQGKTPADKIEPAGKSLGTMRTPSAKTNMDRRKQANFLEQLMNIKKNRGEKDNVPVVMNERISKILKKGKNLLSTEDREKIIENLNRRVVRGDAEAFRKLKELYEQIEVSETEDDAEFESDHQPEGSSVPELGRADHIEPALYRPSMLATSIPYHLPHSQ